MSLLLDTLKKIASEKEGKKKGLVVGLDEESVDVKIEKKEVVDDPDEQDTPLSIVVEDNLKPIGLNLKANEGFQKKDIVDEVASDKLDANENIEPISLKLATSDGLNIDTSDELSLKIDEPLVDKISINELFEEVEAQTVKETVQPTNDDWSLSHIPGYQQYNNSTENQKKTQKILGVFALQKKPIKRKSSRLFVYIGLILILLLWLSYFGMKSYKSKSLAWEKNLQQYQLPSFTGVDDASIINVNKPLDINKDDYAEKTITPQATEGLQTLIEDEQQNNSASVNQTIVAKATEDLQKNIIKDSNRPQEQKVATVINKPVVSKPKANEVLQEQNATEGLQKDNISIKIEQQNVKEKQAFAAFQQGDMQKSANLYRVLLQKNNKNIFALSGLGAIAIAEGNYLAAKNFYENILQIEPFNKESQHALLKLKALMGDNEGVLSNIESLIQKSPHDAGLRFALGNYFAKNGNWVKAQEQYFIATSMNPNNQIYTLNLAISMDQLGMHASALKFYKQTLGLTQIQGSSFDEAIVKNRIKALTYFITGEQ